MNDASPSVLHGLETPYPLAPCQNYFRLEGWALVRAGTQASRVRIRIDERCFAPDSTPERPDVATLYPEESHALASGFVFVVFLAFGNYLGHLEVSGDGGATWLPVRTMMIPVSSHPLLGQFEPAGNHGLITETMRPSGWVWHPEFQLASVELLFGDIEVPLEFGLPRPDVATRFPDDPRAGFCGFITQENLPRGKGELRLRTTTRCGRVFHLDPNLQADLPDGAYPPLPPPPEMWELPIPSGPSHPRPPPASTASAGMEPGANNILFVLYGDFTSNSAHHVTAIANELIGQGFDCIVAVPAHAETIGAQPHARFLAVEFSELTDLPLFFKDGCAPSLVHAWTTRENVRHFTEDIRTRYGSDVVIHLEDNERLLLASHLRCTETDLLAKNDAELTDLVPAELSHPHRANEFLASAQGVSIIVEGLRDFVPSDVPVRCVWPAALPVFHARPRDDALRRRWGIPDTDVVLFYHGNVHAANAAEVGELYQAVHLLNVAHVPTWLVRTGRDAAEFGDISARLGDHLIHAGFVKRSKDLAELMSVADYFVQPGAPGPFNDYRFPSKLPEFFALGRPVILPACNLGAHVQHGRDAYVLPEANAAAIQQAIAALQSDPTLRDTLSAGAVAFAQAHFSWPETCRVLVDFYLQCTCLERPTAARIRTARSLSQAHH